MKSLLALILGIIIGGCAVFGYFNYTINKESTAEINKELDIFNKKISALDKEISGYSGGLLPTLLKVQRAVYADAVASLETKKSQFSHWIMLNYPSSAETEKPAGDTEAYDKEIANLESKIEEDKKESAQYRPCLVKSLIDTRIAQNRLTLSGLERARIAKKYNLPFLVIQGEKVPSVPEEEVKQTPEQDKDAI